MISKLENTSCIFSLFGYEAFFTLDEQSEGNKMLTFGLIIRVKGSPSVESIPLIFLYAASDELRGNISTMVCCNF